MGSFANSVHVRCDDPDRVVTAVQELLSRSGYVATDEPAPDDPHSDDPHSGGPSSLRVIHLFSGPLGWVGLLDSDLLMAATLGMELSRELQTHVLQVLVNDSDSWCYQLFHLGGELDVFDSQVGEDVDAALPPELMGLPGDDLHDLMTDQGDAALDRVRDTLLNQLGDPLENAPLEMRDILARCEQGRASAEEMERYQAWIQSQLPHFFQAALDAIGESDPAGAVDPRVSLEFERQLEQRTPPEILEIRESIEQGEADERQQEIYRNWANKEMPQLCVDLFREMRLGDRGYSDPADEENAAAATAAAEMARRIRQWNDTIPPSIRDVILRIKTGEHLIEDLRSYSDWLCREGSELTQAARANLPTLDELRQPPVDSVDYDEDYDGEQVGDEVSGEGSPADADLPPLEDEEALRDHALWLEPLLARDVGADEMVRVLASRAVFAEHVLERFLILIGISKAYSGLSYEYLREFSDGDLRSEGLHRLADLRFRRSPSGPKPPGTRPPGTRLPGTRLPGNRPRRSDDEPPILRFPGG